MSAGKLLHQNAPHLARYAKMHSRSKAAAITFGELIDRGLAGDQKAKDALVETAYYLGLGISNLLKGLSPEAVIVGGQISRAWPVIADELTNAVTQSIICAVCHLPA